MAGSGPPLRPPLPVPCGRRRLPAARPLPRRPPAGEGAHASRNLDPPRHAADPQSTLARESPTHGSRGAALSGSRCQSLGPHRVAPLKSLHPVAFLVHAAWSRATRLRHRRRDSGEPHRAAGFGPCLSSICRVLDTDGFRDVFAEWTPHASCCAFGLYSSWSTHPDEVWQMLIDSS
jgi:hypothetical protein